MTRPAARFGVERRNQERQAARAAGLLDHARAVVEHERPGEDPAERARRLRGAALVAQNAVAELWVTVGWLEAAQAASLHGLIEETPDETPE